MTDKTFSKEHTLFVKGIAVMLLCWHHLYWHSVTLPLDLPGADFTDLSTELTKVCVALFTILSGYGINESYQRAEGKNGLLFAARHVRRLLVNYWWVYVPAFILSFWLHNGGTPFHIYHIGAPGGIRNLLLDFFGIRALVYSPTLNNTWWYMEAVLCFYLLFPLLRLCMEKCAGLLLFASALPVLYKTAGIAWPEGLTADRELFYLFPFVIGMCLSEYGALDRCVRWAGRHKGEMLTGSAAAVVSAMVLRTQAPMLTDVLYALALILLAIGLKSLHVKALERFLGTFGKYSMDIYLIHSFIYYYFPLCGNLLGRVPHRALRYCVFLAVCLALAAMLEGIKAAVRSVCVRLPRAGVKP